MRRAGFVLAGGRSSRMGRDKALLPCRGGVLIQVVARAVAKASGSAVLVGDPALYGGLGYPVIADEWPGEGPLGGILTALQHSTAEWNLVAACDMPALSPVFLSRLLTAAEANGRVHTLPMGPSGIIEPLCAVYHRAGEPELRSAFAKGIRKITAALQGCPMAVYAVPEASPFQNVNTPEEWDGYDAK